MRKCSQNYYYKDIYIVDPIHKLKSDYLSRLHFARRLMDILLVPDSPTTDILNGDPGVRKNSNFNLMTVFSKMRKSPGLNEIKIEYINAKLFEISKGLALPVRVRTFDLIETRVLNNFFKYWRLVKRKSVQTSVDILSGLHLTK